MKGFKTPFTVEPLKFLKPSCTKTEANANKTLKPSRKNIVLDDPAFGIFLIL